MTRLLAYGWLILLTLAWSPVQAGITFADGQSLSVGAAIVSIPFSACTWTYRTVTAAEMVIWTVGVNGSSNNQITMYVGSNNALVFRVRDTASTDLSPGGVSSNAWQLICGVINATTLTTYRGTSKSTLAHAKVPTGMDTTWIAKHPSAANLEWNGHLAYQMFWNNAELTDAEVAALNAGAPPQRIRPLALVSCPHLWSPTSPVVDECGARGWTVAGSPTQAPSRPPVGFLTLGR